MFQQLTNLDRTCWKGTLALSLAEQANVSQPLRPQNKKPAGLGQRAIGLE